MGSRTLAQLQAHQRRKKMRKDTMRRRRALADVNAAELLGITVTKLRAGRWRAFLLANQKRLKVMAEEVASRSSRYPW